MSISLILGGMGVMVKKSLHERLNRMVSNKTWSEKTPLMCVNHLSVGGLDHIPIKLVGSSGKKKGRLNGVGLCWLTSKMCNQVVEDAWCVNG